jgi:hypothetical protein
MTRHRFALVALLVGVVGVVAVSAQDAKKAAAPPAVQPGADLTIYSPKNHDLYDGRFVLSAGRAYMIGDVKSPKKNFDHIDNGAENAIAVKGTFEIDVDEIKNTGTVTGKFETKDGVLEIAFDEFKEGSPCQNGGIAAFIFEHGDSGCGDANWPKTLTYIAGWGTGHAKLNGKPLWDKQQIHFMVTQGMRDRKSLKVAYPDNERRRKLKGGDVNPSAMQLDFWIRSPEIDKDSGNSPPNKNYLHMFAMEVTWK